VREGESCDCQEEGIETCEKCGTPLEASQIGSCGDCQEPEPESKYEVVVANIGTVYDGADRNEALRKFKLYARDSRRGVGRASRETVHLFCDEELIQDYEPLDWGLDVDQAVTIKATVVATNEEEGVLVRIDGIAETIWIPATAVKQAKL
jgi:hypothetical protein